MSEKAGIDMMGRREECSLFLRLLKLREGEEK
jgi:hypothetical protein